MFFKREIGVVFLATSITALAAAGDAPGAALYAGDFSHGSDGWPLPRTPDNGGAYLVYNRETAVFHHYVGRHPRTPVRSGDILTFEAEVSMPRPMELGGFDIQALFFNRRGDHVGTAQSERVNRTTGWRRLRVTFRVPPKVIAVELRFCNRGRGEVRIRSARLQPATGFDRLRIPQYAGTLEEKKILQSWALRVSGRPAPTHYLTYSDLPNGVRYAVGFVWENPGPGKGSFRFSGTPEGVFWPWPNRRRLQTVTFHIRARHLRGDLRLTLSCDEYGGQWNKWTTSPTALADLGDGWRQMTVSAREFKPVPGATSVAPDWKRVIAPAFEVTGGPGRILLEVADVALHFDDGARLKQFAVWRDPYWYYPRIAKPMTPPGPDPRFRIMQGGGAFFVETEVGRRTLENLKGILPNFGIQSNLGLQSLLGHRGWFVEHDIALGFQNISPFLWQAAVEEDALDYPLDAYKSINERHHKFDYTAPGWRRIYARVADRFAKYGIPEYQIIDGHFSGAPVKTTAAFRRYLTQADDGVAWIDGKRLHFWDYFEAYTGTRWSSTDLAWSSWNEYEHTPAGRYAHPGSPALSRKRGYLDMALRHYAYLKFHADIGRIFKARGIRYFLMNNGDNWENGNDWWFDSSCPDIPGFVEETFFYHPATVIKAYPLGPTFGEAYRLSGAHHRLIGEVGLGGGGWPYWNPEVAYAIFTSICLSKRYDSLEIDWPVAMDWDFRTNPKNKHHYARFCDYLTKCLAYNHATLGPPTRQADDLGQVISLHETPTMTAGGFGNRQLAGLLESLNYPVVWASHLFWDSELTRKSRVVVVDAYALPQGFAGRLAAWLRAEGTRALVLYGPNAGRRIDGTMWGRDWGWDRLGMNAPKQFRTVIGAIARRGDSPRTARYTPSAKPDAVLLADDMGPVLSRYAGPGGGRVYFYHCVPRIDERMDRTAFDRIMQAEGIEKSLREERGHLVVHRFYQDGGTVCLVLFNRDSLDAYRFSPRSGGERFAYPWKVRLAYASGRTRAVPPGAYVLYGFLSGAERRVDISRDGGLDLFLDGITAEVYYAVPLSDKDRLQQLKRHRAEVFRWLDRRTK